MTFWDNYLEITLDLLKFYEKHTDSVKLGSECIGKLQKAKNQKLKAKANFRVVIFRLQQVLKYITSFHSLWFFNFNILHVFLDGY